MNRSAVRREFRSAIWPHERGSAGSSWLGGSDDEGLASGLDDVSSHGREVVDRHDAVDLGDQALDEADVAAGDAGDRGEGVWVVEYAGGDLQSEFGGVLGE